jgi:hypothetical protein
MPEPIADEHILLDDNKCPRAHRPLVPMYDPACGCRYVADVLMEFKNSRQAKDGWQSRLLFKKRMFRETDETITEPQFINLSYVQVCAAGCCCRGVMRGLTPAG